MTPNPQPIEHAQPQELPARLVPSHSGPPVVRMASPGLPAKFDPIDLLKAFRRRWPLAIAAGLALAMLVAPVVYALMPPAKYTANARLLVSSVAPAIIFKTR
ncbi:MAG: capsular biosynthesis protein, partial [Isosphaeraceae bacterium]